MATKRVSRGNETPEDHYTMAHGKAGTVSGLDPKWIREFADGIVDGKYGKFFFPGSPLGYLTYNSDALRKCIADGVAAEFGVTVKPKR